MSEKKSLEFFGMPWYVALVTVAVVLVAAYTGGLSKDLLGSFALMFAIGLVFYEIGERIPLWNTYIGGGIVLAFIGTAVLVYFNLIPEAYLKSMNTVMDDQDFLSFFIAVLITGSILSLERNILLKSFAGYIPAILGGLIGAAALGVLGGLLFGVSPSLTILKYVLPIMGGGNGGGAVPLSQIYEQVTGQPKTEYYAFAIAVLTIANIFAIITAAVLGKIGEKKPSWTGDGTVLMRKYKEIKSESGKTSATLAQVGGGLILSGGFYALGRLFGKVLLPKIFGVAIHPFAYMILFVALVSALGIIPEGLRTGAKKLQSFFTGTLILIIMVGVGADTSLKELLDAITFGNVVMAFLIVVGAILGSAVTGYLVGFYPIDSAITAGLCMANRGGSGDLAVLGASKRMGLMAYAQLSSRLGGGIVLVIGSILFSLLW
ncbi:2-hydroxycarboxylate transporter family protein [Treponema vincentii]|uniref:2-hydroxycarboxylate transporter family protein n=1 Tax=Treponema vincentii TaxID=69710 RepID=UPI0020A51C7D|nr:2-hydroxycarboxylate transporter family protein [Treponema vincentii]UTC45468.1 2-hydroxycarboxylate transporter family protein [Treponema vincentii]